MAAEGENGAAGDAPAQTAAATAPAAQRISPARRAAAAAAVRRFADKLAGRDTDLMGPGLRPGECSKPLNLTRTCEHMKVNEQFCRLDIILRCHHHRNGAVIVSHSPQLLLRLWLAACAFCLQLQIESCQSSSENHDNWFKKIVFM